MSKVIEENMLALLHGFHGKLPNKAYEDIRDLIVHREWAVGLENLCENLYEYNVMIPPTTLATIKGLAEQMQLNPKRWNFLEKAKKNEPTGQP